ncbi:hypothetical protein PG994_015199 (mitochondrion) [Apiospora phragmitis]|uniref:Aminotransferase n=1 Tax=Apiospora phragmitis TaxID=2905665 RepID=A0ABR1SS89_9PEZI
MEPADYTFDRNLLGSSPKIKKGSGYYLITKDGRKVFDAASGAAVSCLGHGKIKVQLALVKQIFTGITYLASSFWANDIVNDLCAELIQGTNNQMGRVYLTGSGSEAMEAALKLSRQYFYEQNSETTRVNFISRERSYHGNTIGALSVSGFKARTKPYEPLLMKNVSFIPPCYQYRQQGADESDQDFVYRKVLELEDKFQQLPHESVIAFIAEPVVGAALGCVPSPPGYLKGIREVCDKHGALLILDEVMSGMGRTGTLHAWQQDNVVPDIQTVAKALGGGYVPVGAVLVSNNIYDVIKKISGVFVHGQTYQSMPLQAAAALSVQRIIRKKNLVENVAIQGRYLGDQLHDKLSEHTNVGNIRGKGLFWGIEFVENKDTSEPFASALEVATKIVKLGISEFDIAVYPSTGCADGARGGRDHIMIAPAYTVTKKDVDYIVSKVNLLVTTFFF